MGWLPGGSLGRVLGRLAARRQPLQPGMPAVGAPRLTATPAGTPRCVACALCAGACPAQCIEVSAGLLPAGSPDQERGRTPIHFAVDLGRCISCGLCAAACPEEAITMTPSVPMGARTDVEDLRLNLDELLEPA